jgi:hypothetical protein
VWWPALVGGRRRVSGDLPAALGRFRGAVSGLVEPSRGWFGGVVRVAPSVYSELSAAVNAAQQRGDRARRVAQSQPTIWCAALDLKDQIDAGVAQWSPPGDGLPRCGTVERLRALAGLDWRATNSLPVEKARPQDAEPLTVAAARVEGWHGQVLRLLDPPPLLELTVACPACGERWVRRVVDGERVRQAALRVDAGGAACQACEASWSPEGLVEFARLLGVVPANVLE